MTMGIACQHWERWSSIERGRRECADRAVADDSLDRLVFSQPLSGLTAYAKAYLSVGNQ
jgi:hypothetical protein